MATNLGLFERGKKTFLSFDPVLFLKALCGSNAVAVKKLG